MKETDMDFFRSRHKKSLLTLTNEERKEIKKKKLDVRLKKLDRREKLMEKEKERIKERRMKLLEEIFSDQEQQSDGSEVNS